MMKNETDIQRDIFRKCVRNDRIAWIARNNVGVYKRGKSIIRYGLGVGSSDLIGQLKDGRFLAIECKTRTGRTTKEQDLFLNRVKMWGGVAIVCRSSSELDSQLEDI